MNMQPSERATSLGKLWLILSTACVHLFFGSLPTSAQGTDQLLLALRTETVRIETGKTLDCQTYAPEALGFTLAEKVPIRDEVDLRATFRIHIYRTAASSFTKGTAAVHGAAAIYRDYVLAGHFWDDAAIQAMQAFLLSEGVDGRAIITALPCSYRSEEELFVYRPLASPEDGLWHIAPQLQPFRFDLFEKPVQSDDATPEPTSAGSVADGEKEETDVPAGKPVLPYGWTSAPLLKRLAAFEDVFVLDRVECDTEGNFFVGSTAEIVGAPSADLTEPISIIRTSMYAVTNYVGASGAPDDRASVEASVDPSHYWCIPKQEFCYKKIKFGQFGVPSSAGETKKVSRDTVYNLRLGLVSVIQQITNDHCTESAIADRSER